MKYKPHLVVKIKSVPVEKNKQKFERIKLNHGYNSTLKQILKTIN